MGHLLEGELREEGGDFLRGHRTAALGIKDPKRASRFPTDSAIFGLRQVDPRLLKGIFARRRQRLPMRDAEQEVQHAQLGLGGPHLLAAEFVGNDLACEREHLTQIRRELNDSKLRLQSRILGLEFLKLRLVLRRVRHDRLAQG